MKIKTLAICVLLIIPYIFFCQDKQITKKIDFSKCKPSMPNPKIFCGDVGGKAQYNEPDSNFEYRYQQVMYQSACADVDTMSDKEINLKLQQWWDLYKDKLLCDSIQFNVPNGSVFKYAIRGYVTSFIDDAIYAKFDLNFVDKADGRTVLDYTRDEIKKHTKASPVKKILESYYTKLRNAGAKHKSEL